MLATSPSKHVLLGERQNEALPRSSGTGERGFVCVCLGAEKRDNCELARSLTNKDVGGKIRNVGAREDRKMQETCIFSSPRLEV